MDGVLAVVGIEHHVIITQCREVDKRNGSRHMSRVGYGVAYTNTIIHGKT
jgi:hypothetical protein